MNDIDLLTEFFFSNSLTQDKSSSLDNLLKQPSPPTKAVNAALYTWTRTGLETRDLTFLHHLHTMNMNISGFKLTLHNYSCCCWVFDRWVLDSCELASQPDSVKLSSNKVEMRWYWLSRDRCFSACWTSPSACSSACNRWLTIFSPSWTLLLLWMLPIESTLLGDVGNMSGSYIE